MVKIAPLGVAARSAAFSPAGELLAVGLKNGAFVVLKTADLKTVAQKRDRHQAIQDVRWVTGSIKIRLHVTVGEFSTWYDQTLKIEHILVVNPNLDNVWLLGQLFKKQGRGVKFLTAENNQPSSRVGNLIQVLPDFKPCALINLASSQMREYT